MLINSKKIPKKKTQEKIFGWIWRQYFGEKEGVKSGLKFGAKCLCYYWD